VNIYTENPSFANYTLAATGTEKRLENYKYDDKKRLVEVDITDAITGAGLDQIYYRYDDNDNNVQPIITGGNSKAILTVSAKYDDHPSAYIKHPGSQIYALDRSL